MPDRLTLHQAADELGVHYMTAYRYVRLGHLPADKVEGEWRVRRADVAEYQRQRSERPTGRVKTAPWADRLHDRLIAGDAPGAWGVVEAALTSGTDVSGVYTEMLVPCLHRIGTEWASGEIDVAVEHLASGIATRVVGRLGSRCQRPGRSRGTVLVGAPPGELHALATAILADLLRLDGWSVVDLGANTPPEAFALMAGAIDDLVAVGVSITAPACLSAGAATCAALHAGGLGVPIVVGGQAVDDEAHACELGADAFAGSTTELSRFLAGAVMRADPVR